MIKERACWLQTLRSIFKCHGAPLAALLQPTRNTAPGPKPQAPAQAASQSDTPYRQTVWHSLDPVRPGSIRTGNLDSLH